MKHTITLSVLLGLGLCAPALAHDDHDHADTGMAAPTTQPFPPVAQIKPPKEIIWLADFAPMAKKAPDVPAAAPAAPTAMPTKHDHGSSVENAVADVGERAGNAADMKNLWLRQGGDAMRSPALTSLDPAQTIKVVGSEGAPWIVTPQNDAGRVLARVGISEMGFYNAYLTQAVVENGHLEALVAKAEILKGTCCKKGVDPAQEKAISDDSQPIELVRDHMPDEKLFTRLVSGDKVAFTVTSFGQPLGGALVTLSTQQGWKKTLVSNDKGRVEFTLIRDYFPDWSDFKRLTKQTFLVVAEADSQGHGLWGGQMFHSAHLRTSLAGKYSPSPYDYRSYAFGLGISGGIALFLGTAIYLYRRRRVKPFKEVRFHEQD